MTDGKTDGTDRHEYPSSRMLKQSRTPCFGAVGYEIRIKDHLDTYWLEWFEGWSVTNLENGEVLLKSNFVDQSRLHGVLNKIRDLNLTLLAVTCIPADGHAIHPCTDEE
jgi:hypothetical protein